MHSETSEVSIHLCRTFLVVKNAAGWLTAKEIATKAAVAERTARAHVLHLVKLGLLDQAEVFPGHRYKLAETAGKRNRAMLQRIETACDIFSLV